MNRTRNNEARERERCTPWNGQVNPLISDTESESLNERELEHHCGRKWNFKREFVCCLSSCSGKFQL